MAMRIGAATVGSARAYRNLFDGYVLKRVQVVLRRVEQVLQAVPLLPEETLKAALHSLEYALKLPDAWPHTRALLLALAHPLEQAGYRDEWIPYLDQGIQLSRQLGDVETEAKLHLQLGILYQLRSKYEPARTHFEAGAAGFEQIEATREQARSLNHLAYVARMQRRFEEAAHWVSTVHHLTDAAEERAFGYYVLGLIALDNRQWQQAVDYSAQAYDLLKATNQWQLMGRTLLCRGVALQEMKQYQQAIKVNEQAIALFERSQDLFYKAVAQMNQGIVCKNLEQLPQALALYLSAEKIFRQVQDQHHSGLVTHNIGHIYRKLGQWADAKAAYRKSISVKQEIGNLNLLIDTMDSLGMVSLEEGDFIEARRIFQDALTLLPQIEGHGWYDYLLNALTTHLDEATVGLTPQEKQKS